MNKFWIKLLVSRRNKCIYLLLHIFAKDEYRPAHTESHEHLVKQTTSTVQTRFPAQ